VVSETIEAPGETAPPSMPHSWRTLLAGLAICAALACLSLGLIGRFLVKRPIDLRGNMLGLAVQFEDSLAAHQIPRANVVRQESINKRDEQALWQHYTFEVAVPETLSAEGVERLIRRAMLERNVAVSAVSTPTPTDRTLALTSFGREFATVRLTGGKPPILERTDLTVACGRLADEMQALLEAHGVAHGDIQRAPATPRQNDTAQWTFTEITAPLPQGLSVAALQSLIESGLSQRDEVVAAPDTDHTGKTARFTITYMGLECLVLEVASAGTEQPSTDVPPVQLPVLSPLLMEPSGEEEDEPDVERLPLDSQDLNGASLTQQPEGTEAPANTPLQVAIIVDDGGYGGATTDKILGLDPRLTLAILPNTPKATDTAEQAIKKGFEVIIHMPMESFSPASDFPGCLRIGMADGEILSSLRQAIDEIPCAVGVNNHTGSKFTSDEKAMGAFLKALSTFTTAEDKPFYFIDSCTTRHSVAHRVAMALGIPTEVRDVFLDDKPDAAFREAQFENLVAWCKKDGAAIGICHFRAASAAFLADKLQELERRGITLVHASELVQ